MPTKYQIQPCSPKAAERVIVSPVSVGTEPMPEGVNVYPFSEMQPGQCFVLPFDSCNEKTVRNRVSTRNKKDVRQFIVIKHNEFQCYEVARIV